MRQVTQRLKDGHIEVIDVPTPEISEQQVLIALRASLLSAGTERSKVETAKKSLVGKARARPDQVNQVIAKARVDGLRSTVAAVRMRLNEPSSLGYSAAGIVVAVGGRVRGLGPGDHVACGGGDHAVHAEVVSVPGNLCVKLPTNVGFDAGAFVTVGAIAMHGLRQADVRLGERVAVIGLGLVGQLTGMLLRASGVTVVGIDLDERLCDRAMDVGATNVAFQRLRVDGAMPHGVADCDAIIITAATRSSDPVVLAARLARDRARVVVVGDVGLDVPRAPYYDKEIDIRLSRSYGPGRYDHEYEERGLDYPVGYVRWTERRNMQAVVDLMGAGRIDVRPLIAHRFPVADAPEAFETLVQSEGSPLGIVLEYGRDHVAAAEEMPTPVMRVTRNNPTYVGVIGAGSFAQRILIPAAERAGFQLAAVSSATGLSAVSVASSRPGTRAATTEELLADESIETVLVATRHSSHAELAERALLSGRAVFVEKPPALTNEELTRLRRTRDTAPGPLFVGFNRRYAPVWEHVNRHLGLDASRQVVMRVNAGPLPRGHWLNDPQVGGGRLIGEGCHFIDLACWLIGAIPARVSCSAPERDEIQRGMSQCFSVTLSFHDGSLASISYLDAGARRLEKESVEIHSNGRSAVVHDYRAVDLHGEGKTIYTKRRGHDKGHRAQLMAFATAVQGGPGPVAVDPLDTMAVTFAAVAALERSAPVDLYD